MSTTTTYPQFGTSPLPMRKFTVAEYHRMIETGILTENDQVELLQGWIVPKMPRNPPHDVGVEVVRNVVQRTVPPGWSIRSQSAITTADSEPEPDVAVVRGEPRTYRLRHPGPADIGMLIEVSEATLGRDRGEKGSIYAHAGVPYYWIVNLVNHTIEVYTDPDTAASAYRSRMNYGRADPIPLILDGQTVAMLLVADLLP
jgi:Uma2 family endonuclease